MNETPNQPEENLFDRDDLLARLDGDKAFLQELLRTFLEDVPKQLAKMAQASSEGDTVTITEIAHSLKSAGGVVCAYSFKKTAADLEISAKLGAMDDVRQVVQQLEQDFQQLRTVMAPEKVLS